MVQAQPAPSPRGTVFFTWRVGALAAGVAALWLLSGVSWLFGAVAVVANLALLYAVWLDADRTTGAEALEVTRHHDPQLSLGAANRVTLRVRSRSSEPMRLEVRDGPPLEMSPDPPTFRVTLAPGEARELEYSLTPTERGEYRFREAWVRREGRWGLITRQLATPLAGTVRVFPNVLETRKYETLLLRHRLNELGLRASRSIGAGREFSALRDYQPDDEFRAIDWNATSRRVRLTVRQYEVERSRPVIVLLDCGRLMGSPVQGIERASQGDDAPSTALDLSAPASRRAPDIHPELRMTKLDFAVNAALVFSHVALAMGDRVGLLTFSEEIGEFIPPGAGSDHLPRILHALYRVQASRLDSDFAEAYLQVERELRKRSMILLFTDLMDAESNQHTVKYLGMMARRRLCVCVAVGDPEVAEWATRPPVSDEGVYRQAVALATLNDRAIALADLRRRGVHVMDTLPHTLTAEAVNRYLQVKARGLL